MQVGEWLNRSDLYEIIYTYSILIHIHIKNINILPLTQHISTHCMDGSKVAMQLIK